MRFPGMKYTVCLLAIFCAITLLAFTTSPVYATAEPFETSEDNPQLAFFPLIQGPTPAKVVIAAAHIDSAISYEPDEAVMLWNVGGSEVDLAGWQILGPARVMASVQSADGGLYRIDGAESLALAEGDHMAEVTVPAYFLSLV